jgi:hypothetical protein
MLTDAELPVPCTNDSVPVQLQGSSNDKFFRFSYRSANYSRSHSFHRQGDPGGLGPVFVYTRGQKTLFLFPHYPMWHRCLLVDRSTREMTEYPLREGAPGDFLPDSLTVCSQRLNKTAFLANPRIPNCRHSDTTLLEPIHP